MLTTVLYITQANDYEAAGARGLALHGARKLPWGAPWPSLISTSFDPYLVPTPEYPNFKIFLGYKAR